MEEMGASLKPEKDGDGWKIGSVRIDPEARTVTIPAAVNMNRGTVEYALVTRTGKVHEALFATEATPAQIHMACVLLGGKAAEIAVTWETNGPRVTRPLAELVVCAADEPGKAAVPMTAGQWTYVGSRFDAAGFAAEREGSIIALISDPAALVTNPRPDQARDDIHSPNEKLLPGLKSPVKVILKFAPVAVAPGR